MFITVRRKPFKLRTTITLLVCAVVALALLAAHLLYLTRATRWTMEGIREQALAVGHTVALFPLVTEALEQPGTNTSDALQNNIERIRAANDLLFIVVMDMDGIRLTHPDPRRIGEHFVGGDEIDVLKGYESVSEAKGTLGPSMRIFVPVSSGSKQIGAIAVGISMDKVNRAAGESRQVTYWVLALGGLTGMAGAFVLARQIKRIMLGMEPVEITTLLTQRNAMLEAIREGMLAVDVSGRITLVNDEARRLFIRSGLEGEPLFQEAEQFWPSLPFSLVMESGVPRLDEAISLNGTELLVNCVPVQVSGRIAGAIATFRDKTEVSRLVRQLSGVSYYAEALRAQTHEFMNKLHVILGMTHMGYYDKLEEYVTDTVDSYQEEIGGLIRQIRDPVLAGFLLGKMNQVREAGLRLTLTEESSLPEAADPEVNHALVTIIGNLVDNAIDALTGAWDSKDIVLSMDYNPEEALLHFTVSDNGCGISSRDLPYIYHRGFSTKGGSRGIGLRLVKDALAKRGGSITCEAKERGGTTFTVKMPYIAKEGSL